MRQALFALLFLLTALSSAAQFTNVVVGNAANDGTGDNLRAAFQKLNFADNWLKTNLTTVSNLVGSSGGANKVSTNNGSHWVTATSSTTTRAVQDRFAERKNVRDFGAIPDDAIDDTIAIQRAIDAAIDAKTSVFAPAGVYILSPQSTNTAVLLMHYSSYPAGSGVTSSTGTRQETYQFNSLLIEGVDTGKRLNRIDTTPHETYTRGTVFKFTNMVSGSIGIQSGYLARNSRIKNITFVGTGHGSSTIGARHNATSSHFELENCAFWHWGTAVDIGGDWESVVDAHADYNTIRRVTIWNSDVGVKLGGLNAYITHIENCDISARICVQNNVASLGNRPGPGVQISNGFLQPLTEYGGILLTGVVSSATSSSFTVGAVDSITKHRAADQSLYVSNVVGSVSVVDTNNWFVLVEKNSAATGVARVPDWGVLGKVTGIAGSTITVDSSNDTTATTGAAIYIFKPAVALYGDNFNVNGTHIEQTNAEDFGFGPMIGWFGGWRSTVSLRNLLVNLYSEDSGFNRIVPKIYHKPTYSFHGCPLEIASSTFNVLFPKLEVTGTAGVRFRQNNWYCEPLILGHTGVLAEGVLREGDNHFLKMRIPYDQSGGALEYRALVANTGRDVYEQFASGLNRRNFIPSTSVPTKGTTGETFVLDSNPQAFYRIGTSQSIAGYYDPAAIEAGTAEITSGSNLMTVTNLAGLYVGRVISIAGAGTGAAALVTRIVDMYVNEDASIKRVWLLANAGTTVALTDTSTISAVSPTILAAQQFGTATATAEPVTIFGGSSASPMMKFIRSDGLVTPQTNYFTAGDGIFDLWDATAGRKMQTWTRLSSTNAAQIHGDLKLGYVTSTNGATLLGATAMATASVNPDAYDATAWNGSTNVPTKDAFRDEIESLRAAKLSVASNLSDVANAATARDNLGVEIGADVQAFDADLTAWAAVNPSSYTATASMNESSELAGILGDETGTGALVFGTSPTIVAPTISGAVSFPDNTRQTFNPGADAAGLNVGSHAGDPGTPSNGDLWYDSDANELTARINGANVALGAGGGISDGDKGDITVSSSGTDWQIDSGTITATELADGAVDLTTADVTGTLPTSKGGTGVTSFAAGTDYVAPSTTGVAATAYTLPISQTSANPADATVYYIGAQTGAVYTTTVGNANILVPRGGTIKRIWLRFTNNNVNGTTEQSTLALNINGSDTDTLSSTFQHNSTFATLSATSLSRSVSAGDTIAIKFTTPTWTTNPTGVGVTGYIYIE